MQCVDDRILEALDDSEGNWITPGYLSTLDGIHATTSQVRERCKVLADADFVTSLTEDADLVALTTEGQQYLEGKVDVELYYPIVTKGVLELSPDTSEMSRRNFLRTAGATAVGASIAGCSNGDGSPGRETESEDTTTPESTPEPTPTPPSPPQVSVENADIEITWSPEMNRRQEMPGEHVAGVHVEPGEGKSIDDVGLYLEDGDETRTLGVGIENAEIPANELPAGESRIYAEERSTGLVSEKDVHKQVPDNYRAEVVNSNGETLNDWSTIYSFDNLPFNQEEMNEMRESWLWQGSFPGFVSEVRQNKDFDDYTFVIFPNYDETEKGDSSGGFFDLEDFKGSDFRKALRYIQGAARAEIANEVDASGPSAWAGEAAASAELAMDKVHPEHKTRGWGTHNPDKEGGYHGTMVFYDESGDTGWWHVDTTDESVVKPEDAQKHRTDIWSPFTSKDAEMPGFQPGESETTSILPGGYRQKTRAARNSILGMVPGTTNIENFWDRVFITDPWMDDAYEHIREGGDIDPILDEIEELVFGQIESEEYVGLYGTLDDSRMAAGEDLVDLYNDVMLNSEVMTTEKVESRLAG